MEMDNSLKKLLDRLDESFNIPNKEDEEQVTEENVTGDADGSYMTPNAFTKKAKVPDDAAYSEKVHHTERFYKKIEDIYNKLDSKVSTINELNYKSYKEDDSKSERQKINTNILEINRKLREVEQMITHASKLKLETGAGTDVYWKGTLGSFLKIRERLNRLSQAIVEMNS